MDCGLLKSVEYICKIMKPYSKISSIVKSNFLFKFAKCFISNKSKTHF